MNDQELDRALRGLAVPRGGAVGGGSPVAPRFEVGGDDGVREGGGAVREGGRRNDSPPIHWLGGWEGGGAAVREGGGDRGGIVAPDPAARQRALRALARGLSPTDRLVRARASCVVALVVGQVGWGLGRAGALLGWW